MKCTLEHYSNGGKNGYEDRLARKIEDIIKGRQSSVVQTVEDKLLDRTISCIYTRVVLTEKIIPKQKRIKTFIQFSERYNNHSNE
jgi:hypothetical protein